jgi:hypothetical protein
MLACKIQREGDFTIGALHGPIWTQAENGNFEGTAASGGNGRIACQSSLAGRLYNPKPCRRDVSHLPPCEAPAQQSSSPVFYPLHQLSTMKLRTDLVYLIEARLVYK